MPAPARKPSTKPRRRKPALSREQGKAQRAEALLDAAWAVFCEVGYEALTIEQVAERAGYSRQPVYTLFGDKQNLFTELQLRATRAVMELLFAQLPPGTSLRETLTRVANVVAAQLNSDKPTHGEQLFIVSQAVAINRPDLALKLQAQAQRVIEGIAAVIRSSSLAPGESLRNESEVIASHLAAHINGLTTVQYQTGKRVASAADLAETFLFLAIRQDSGQAL